jgi:hypothetical protein
MATGTIDRANPLDQPASRKALVSAEYQKQTVPGTTIAKAFYDGEDLSGLDPGESYALHQGPYLTFSRPHHAGLRCRRKPSSKRPVQYP